MHVSKPYNMRIIQFIDMCEIGTTCMRMKNLKNNKKKTPPHTHTHAMQATLSILNIMVWSTCGRRWSTATVIIINIPFVLVFIFNFPANEFKAK